MPKSPARSNDLRDNVNTKKSGPNAMRYNGTAGTI